MAGLYHRHLLLYHNIPLYWTSHVREGGRERGREGGKEGGREGKKEGREGKREGVSDSVCDRASVHSSTWGYMMITVQSSIQRCQCFHRNYFVSPPVCFWRTSMILGVQRPTLSTGQPYTYCTPVTSSCVRLSFSPPPYPLLPPPSCLLSYFLHSLVYWLSAVASPFLGIMVDKLGFNLFFRESCFM